MFTVSVTAPEFINITSTYSPHVSVSESRLCDSSTWVRFRVTESLLILVLVY